jgi:protein-tyrosine phosphatase
MLHNATGRIDVHSHLLPGIDDGCSSLEESLACARMLVDAGYTHSFCTPHIWPNLPENNARIIPERVATLQQSLDENAIPLKLLPGGELNMTADTAKLKKEEVMTYGLAGTHVLIDLWADALPRFFGDAVRNLQSMGLKVILAHPERMRAVQLYPDELGDHFEEIGLLLQCNLQCLSDPQTASTFQVAEMYLDQDRYFMLGSDLHNLASLPARMNGLRRAMEMVGEEKVWQLTRENPKLLVPHTS